MQLYLIRHAQSVNNARWAETRSDIDRDPDPEITEIGRQQAQTLAGHLARPLSGDSENGYDPQNRLGYGLTHLYTSLMIRAIHTGLYVAEATGLPLVALADIHEWGGIYKHNRETDERKGLPGLSRQDFRARFPDLVLPETISETGWWNRPFETEEEALGRARQFLLNLLERHGDSEDRIALITHAGFSLSLLQVIVQFSQRQVELDMSRRVWFRKNNTAISRVDFRGEAVIISYVNNVRFLPDALIT